MARRRASAASTITAAPSRATGSGDRTLYTHNLWLNYLKPVSLGLVFSSSALRAAQIKLPLQSAEAQRALEVLTVPLPVADDEDVDQENHPRMLRSTRDFLIEFLGWKPELLDFFRPSARAQVFAGQANADRSSVLRAVTAETIREDEARASWVSRSRGDGPLGRLSTRIRRG